MIIAGKFSFNGGEEAVQARYPHLLAEVESVIASVDAELYRTKIRVEKTMLNRLLYNPKALNNAFRQSFGALDWTNRKIQCNYPTEYYTKDYRAKAVKKGSVPFRDMDFLKEQLGIEVQFGKYAFMVYNVCAKMTIFRNLGYIDCGIEIVPVKAFADEMSTGVSYFEQFVWDLESRGVSNIDIPVMIIGLDA